jgi:hypothetical protein
MMDNGLPLLQMEGLLAVGCDVSRLETVQYNHTFGMPNKSQRLDV